MKFDSSGVAAVKARADIVEIVRRYVDLRPVGGRLVGVCPSTRRPRDRSTSTRIGDTSIVSGVRPRGT
jgi:hypothetical protein